MTARQADTTAAKPADEFPPGDRALTPPVVSTPETIRAALDQVLQSAKFEASPRSRRFLAYVIEETLAGRADRIKAFSIATDVFGRGIDFDAHSDPIVRLEAGRLRRGLEQYYQTAGSDDPIVISIPKGAYVPQFTARPAPEAATPGAARRRDPKMPSRVALTGMVLAPLLALFIGLAFTWAAEWRPWCAAPFGPAVPRLLVRPFDALNDSGPAVIVAGGLTQEILGQLAKFQDIVTVEGERGNPDDLGARYVLLGSVSLVGEKLRLQARVLDAEDVSVLWAKTYDANYEPARRIAIEDDLARQIATAVGQPYGVIHRADAGRSRSVASGDWASYSCTLSYFTYRANLDARSHPRVRSCLEETVARFPDYATAWALLAQTYMDEMRFHYPVAEATSPASLERAAAAAKRATELDPENVRALQAKMLVLYFDGQVEASLAVGERAMRINPNDTELIGEYGVRLADSGQWKRGCLLVAEALERNPGPLGYYEVILSICAYVEQDYQTAKMWVRRAAVMDNPAYHLIAAAIFAEGGEPSEATAEGRWLMTNAPEFVANVRAWVGLRNVPPGDRERFLASLRKAGLVVSP